MRHYTFDSDYTDSSATADHGVFTDVGTMGNSGIINTAGDWKVGGGALNLSSDRDFVGFTSFTIGSGNAYSVAFWARKAAGDTGDPSTWDMVLGERGDTDFFIGLNDATGTQNRDGIRWRGAINAGGNRESDFVGPNDTEWHHHAFVATAGGLMSYYRDGAFVGSEAGVATGFIFDTIGEAYSTGRDFDFHGQIDDVRIYDEALSGGAVAALAVPEPTTALLMGAGLAGLFWFRRRG